jgi:hypothetical protein
METPNGTYEAIGKRTNGFFEAVAWAKAVSGTVVEVANGLTGWIPASPAKKCVRHVIINADRSAKEFSKVRR